jgi:hypothetical protein
MGTQQILLIVLSVIIVGVAIAVGISMFNSQAYNSNKTAIAADAQSFATQIVQYYKTPVSQGGGGQVLPVAAGNAALNSYLGWTTLASTNDNGNYAVTAITATTVTIVGVGKTAKGTTYPKATTIITFPEGTITTTMSDDGTSTAPSGVTAN